MWFKTLITLRNVNEDETCGGRTGSLTGVPWVPRQSCGQVGDGTSEPPGATWLKLKQSFLFLLNRNCLRESAASGPPCPCRCGAGGVFLEVPLLPSHLPSRLPSSEVWAGTTECWKQTDKQLKGTTGRGGFSVQKEAPAWS